MYAATAVMVLGIAAVAAVSQSTGYRLGGVMVVPLVAIYTFREPLSPFVFVLATLAAWGAVWGIREYTLAHGRRVFLVAVLVGAVVSVLVAFGLSHLTIAWLDYHGAEVVGSIFPGIVAYNLMRVDAQDRTRDIAGMILVYVALLGVGVLALAALANVETGTPALLRLPTSDTVAWLGFETGGTHVSHIVPENVALALLAVDVAIYEGVRARYDIRLSGIILIPLLAVFSARYGNAVLVYALGATAVFFLISLVHWVTLLYGRNLLAVALVAGLVYGLGVGIGQPTAAPGFTLFFIGLFTGIGAYNLHRVSPKNRAASVRGSAGLFVAFYAALLAFAPVPESGFASPLRPRHVVLGGLVVALMALEVYRLEHSIPDGAAFARESVFAEADAEDLADSPLVDGNPGQEGR